MAETNRVLYVGYGFNGEPGLDSLIKEGSFDIVGVVTPLPVVSRLTYRINLDPLPVEILAKKHGLPIIRTNSEDEIHKIIERTEPVSVITCFYNISFSPVILSSGPSFYNIHHGDIPYWKGTSSSEWAIASGRNKVYITLHETVPRIDSGDIVWQEKITITTDEDINDMRRKMNDILRRDLGKVYAEILNPGKYPELREIVYRRKPEGEESYTCSIRETDSEIDWRRPAREIYNLIRALCNEELSPAYTFVDGKQLRIWSAKLIPSSRNYITKVGDQSYCCHIPGKPIIRNEQGVEVLTGDLEKSILLKDVELEGERMPAKEAIRSVRFTLGITKLELLNKNKELEARVKALEEKIGGDKKRRDLW